MISLETNIFPGFLKLVASILYTTRNANGVYLPIISERAYIHITRIVVERWVTITRTNARCSIFDLFGSR